MNAMANPNFTPGAASNLVIEVELTISAK